MLVPVDFSSPSLDALEYAIQVVDRFGAKLTIVHILEPIYFDLELGLGRIEQEVQKRTHWETQLDGLAQVVRVRGLAAGSVVLGGDSIGVDCDLCSWAVLRFDRHGHPRTTWADAFAVRQCG